MRVSERGRNINGCKENDDIREMIPLVTAADQNIIVDLFTTKNQCEGLELLGRNGEKSDEVFLI